MSQSDDAVVFGGSGFIGRRLVAALIPRVRSITVVGRGVIDGHVDESGVRYRRGDLQNLDTAKQVLKGASIVFDLSKPLGSSWDDFHERCVQCAENLAEASLQYGLRRVIYTSTSAAVYLGAKKTVTEADGTDPNAHLRNSYTSGKAAAERLFFDLYHSKGLPITVFRPFLVVGRGGMLMHGGVGNWPGSSMCLGWGNGRNPLPFVLVDDVADAIAAATDAPGVEGKAFNLSGDVCISAREYLRLIAESSKRNYRFVPRNLAVMWLRENFQHFVKALAGRGGVRPTYDEMLSQSKQSYVDCSAAKQILGWKPNTSLERFREEAIDSFFDEIPAGDLRLEA